MPSGISPAGSPPTGWCAPTAWRRRCTRRCSMAATTEVHHAAPRCLLRLHAQAQGELRLAGVGAWLEFEHECQRWGVPVEIAREDLEHLVEASAVVLDREKHRMIHAS